MGTRAPSVDGPNGGGAVRVRVKGCDDDDDGIGMAMLCTAAPESDGRAPVSDTVELGAPGRDAKGKACIGKACTPLDVPAVSCGVKAG